jgi:hypothetical protein
MATITGLTKLIEKELQGMYNPIVYAEEKIYNGSLTSNSTKEIIIPRIGDLIQELNIKYISPSQPLKILNAYIETVCDYEQHVSKSKKQWPLHTFKIDNGLNLTCDYEINLLRPYQVTKLVLVTDKCALNINKYEVNIMASYIFVDIASRRKLFF